MAKKEGAPVGNQNARKPAEQHRQNVTFKLSPENIRRLKKYTGNKSRLVDELLKGYFEAQPIGPEPGNERTG